MPPIFVENDIADGVDSFGDHLQDTQTQGVARLNAAEICPPIPDLDRVSEEHQEEGRKGTKGLITALILAFWDWTITKTTIGGTGAPSFQNSFVAQTSGGQSAYFARHMDGDVVLGGWVAAPASPGGKIVFNISSGSRPPARLWYTVPTDAAAPNNTGTLTIETNGNVVVQIMSNSVNFSLDGIRYRAA